MALGTSDYTTPKHPQRRVCQKTTERAFDFCFCVPFSVPRSMRWLGDYFAFLELTFPSAVRFDCRSWQLSCHGQGEGEIPWRPWPMLQQRALQASEPRIPGQIRQKPWYLPQKNVHRYTAFAYNFSDPHIQIFLSIEGKKCQILKLIFRYFMWFKTKRYKLRNLFAIVLSSG